MRPRPLLVLGAAAALLLSGCASEPTPEPTRSPSESTPTPTATPTPDPVVAPEAAFDVTCDDVAAEMAGLLGEPSTPVAAALSVVSASSWTPGPMQYAFQRAGGIGCSAGDVPGYWEVSIVPGAESVIAGATERGGYFGEQRRCEVGVCVFEFRDGDVLLSASLADPALGAGDVERIGEALARLASLAAGSLRDVAHIDSEIVGMPCERFITEEQVATIAGEDVTLFTDFGGWSVTSEVYQVVNGSRICYYTSAEGDLGSARSYLGITTLPAGAWALEKQGGTPIEIEGAESAKTSTGPHGENILDVRVGVDWIRLFTYDNGSGASDPRPLAEQVVRNLTVGPTAPQ
ncbi:hypothetical protein [Microbacterium sp. CR_7]|uniref:hypothetical protein n=1 Tax=Microbacterium sp. CR_7 TaxID=3055792 RepID=UPI0035C22651